MTITIHRPWKRLVRAVVTRRALWLAVAAYREPLTRRIHESIHIGDGIVVTVLPSRDGRVRLGIDAPKETPIVRAELLPPAVEGGAR